MGTDSDHGNLARRHVHGRVTEPGFAGRDDVFFAAVELTRMPMIVADPNQPDTPVVFANEAFLEMTGFPPEEVIGRNCRFLQGPATDPAAIEAVRAAIRQRTNLSIELLNYRRDGTPFWNALFISPVFDAEGRLLYFFGSQLDVTRRRDAEAALREAQKMEAVGQLTGGIAHDFNNLLTVIAGSVEMLEQAEEPERRARFTSRIREAVDRAQRLTGQLLAFARKQRLDRREVDLNALVEEVAALVGGTLGAGIVLETRLAPGLAPCRADPGQTRLALVNLLLNARDAMPQGGRIAIGTAAVRILPDAPEAAEEALPPGDYAAIEVHDEGHGMSPAVLRRAVEPFFTTKEEAQASGLGLSMVYGLARQSRGHLRLSSRPGEGTSARLLFPSAQPSAEAAAAPLPRGTETLLVVDDNPDVLEAATDLLAPLGYRMLTAGSGREALAVLEAARPPVSLMLTDVVMPGGMNGITLADEARRRHPGLKVLMATGDADAASPAAVPRATMGPPPLGKPFRPAELAGRIRATLDRDPPAEG